MPPSFSLSFSGAKSQSHLITITAFLSSIFKCICYICCIKWLCEYEGIEDRRQLIEEYKEVEEGDEEEKQAGGGRIKKPLRECTCRLCCKVHVNEISERITQFSQSRGFSHILWSKVISGCVPAWKGCFVFVFLKKPRHISFHQSTTHKWCRSHSRKLMRQRVKQLQLH